MKAYTEQQHKDFVADYKREHRILNLQIRQVYLSEILNGTKKQEFREIRPTTEGKLIQRDENKFALEDPDRFITYTEHIEVDVERNEEGPLCVVYHTDEGKTLYPVFMHTDDRGVTYEAVKFEGEIYELVRATGDNGEEECDENGIPYMAIARTEELHCCLPIHYDAINFYIGNTPDTDHALVEVKGAHTEFFTDENDNPIWYDHNGEKYFAEQVVYDLGEIICEYNTTKVVAEVSDFRKGLVKAMADFKDEHGRSSCSLEEAEKMVGALSDLQIRESLMKGETVKECAEFLLQ